MLLPLAACVLPKRTKDRQVGWYSWEGIGFGIDMSMEIHGVDEAEGEALGRECSEEIAALEQAFSLYLADSELSRFNRERVLKSPSPVFRDLFERAISLQARTLGFYQPAIHGAWQWLERHGFRTDADEAGWKEVMAAASLDPVGRMRDGGIRITHPLTAVSMNAVGQGYLADRVATRLRKAGVKRALLHLGETVAIGRHPSGRNWRLAVMGTAVDGQADTVGDVELADAGLAVSANEPSRVLIDPVHACLQRRHRVAAVVSAEGATVADAFATAFAVAPQEYWKPLARSLAKGGEAQVKIWEDNRRAYSFPENS
jgi:thiamine biosynthesis lipoprotein